MTAAAVLEDLADTRPVDDALAGLPDPAGASSPDALTAAVVSAMTLFGRVAIHCVDRRVA